MSKRLRPRRSKSFAKAALTVALCTLATASGAQASSFGYHNVGHFGEGGTLEGQFKKSPIPQRIAVDSFNIVYVADHGNSRIEIFEGTEEEGSYLTQISTPFPNGVAVDSNSGAVYVTKAGTDESQKITPPGSGTYTLSFEGQTTEAIPFGASGAPIEAALEKLSKIGPVNVTVAGREVTFEAALGGQNVPPMTCSPSCSVATSTEGALGKVLKYLPFEAEYPPSFGTKYVADPEFTAPELPIAQIHATNSNFVGGIAVDPTTGNFLVIAGKAVKRFGESGGAPLSSFDGSGSGTAFNAPADLAVDPTGKVLVADITSKSTARVLRFAANGATASTLTPEVPNPGVGPTGPTSKAPGIAIGVDPQSGEAFVSSHSPEAKSPGRIYRYSAANALIESFGVPSTIGTGLDGPITGIGTKGAAEGGSLYVMSSSESGEPAVQVFKPVENVPFTLNVVKEKSGDGSVECQSRFGEEEKTGPCASEYPLGTELAVIATPKEGSVFEFSGDCEGETCEALIEEPHTVTVTFKPEPLPPQQLNVGTTGSGAGAVECKVEGGPAEECSSVYPAETKVELLHKAAGGSEFVEWREDCTGSGSCELTMNAEHSVTAVFNTAGTTPLLSGLSPTKGAAEGGTVVTISGANLAGASAVKFGETNAASFEVKGATEIKATSPAHAAGTVHVTVSAGTSTSASTAADEYTYLPGPTVSSVNPNKGSTAGGTVVTITGTNLTGAEEVKWGTKAVACAGTVATCKVESATEIKATSPEHAAGEVDVTVKTPGGTSATGAPDKYTFQTPAPTVTGVSPNEGSTAGGTVVTITGTNLTGATEVKYGAAAVTCTGVVATCKVKNSTEIEATTPSHAAGTVDVRVVTPGGGESAVNSPADHFTFKTPVVTHTLTINKAGTGSGSVTCNGTTCASTYNQGTSVTLAATAASGSSFAGWSGGGCSGSGNCVVTMNANTAVTATFNATLVEETCATNPALCPPPPTAGTAKAASSALVKSGKAQLKLSCSGGACKGALKLTAKLKVGTKTKSMVIGKASFSLAAGTSKTLKVKLSSAALKVLKSAKTLKAKVSGSGIAGSTVKLKMKK